jgi:hypothetical protein
MILSDAAIVGSRDPPTLEADACSRGVEQPRLAKPFDTVTGRVAADRPVSPRYAFTYAFRDA